MATIREIFGMNRVVPWMSAKAVGIPSPAPDQLMGVELEIENTSPDCVTSGFYFKEDGSLRNNGWEFISQPMTYSNLYWALNTFFNKNKYSERNYSDRTSIHVHMNVQDITPQQLATILMIYQVFEKLLFNFVGEERDKNIYCVPLSECALSYQAVSNLAEENLRLINGWQKYSALNLKTVPNPGTIEFRHMPGTCNLLKINQWLLTLLHIMAYGKNMPFEVVKKQLMHLNTTSAFGQAFENIFGEASTWLDHPRRDEWMEEGVINLKYSLAKAQPLAKKTMYANQVLENLRFDPWRQNPFDEPPPPLPLQEDDPWRTLMTANENDAVARLRARLDQVRQRPGEVQWAYFDDIQRDPRPAEPIDAREREERVEPDDLHEDEE